MKSKSKSKIRTLWIATYTAIILSGCNSSSSSGGPIIIVDYQGASFDLTGTWKSDCYFYNDISKYVVDTNTYSKSRLTMDSTSYTDAACTTGAATELNITGTVKVGAESTVVSWEDGTQTPVPGGPVAADGVSGQLGDNIPYTHLTYTITSGPFAGTHNLGYVIDQTGTTPVLYRSDNIDTTTFDMVGNVDDPLYRQ